MLISIIVPAYNCEKTISSCIESLIEQTYKNIEIIVVDDGSTDNTYNIIQNYVCMDNRIISFRQENRGPGAARNAGMKIAKGQYFAFVDADDIVEAVYIESMIEAADRDNLELVISNVSIYGKNKNKTLGNCIVINGDKKVKSKVVPLIKEGKLNAPIAKLYRLDIQKDNDIYMPTDSDIGEDLQFNLAYIQYVSRMGLLDVNLYTYCTHNSVLTKKYRANEFDIRVKNIKKLEAFLENNCIVDKQFISYLYLKLMYAECMNMRKHLKKEDRLIRIEQLLEKEDVQAAIKELEPMGLLQKVMMFGCKKRSTNRIDFVALVLNIGKELGKNIKRASV